MAATGKRTTRITNLVARPRVSHIPDYGGGVRVKCPACGQECWKLPIEPDPLPPGFVAVCTACFVKPGETKAKLESLN